jgi:hypothetical protein
MNPYLDSAFTASVSGQYTLASQARSVNGHPRTVERHTGTALATNVAQYICPHATCKVPKWACSGWPPPPSGKTNKATRRNLS